MMFVRPPLRRFRHLLMLLVGLVASLHATAAPDSRLDHEADAFFAGATPVFAITVERKFAHQLRSEPRKYVPATVQVGTNVYRNVGIHLKGAAGSTRDFDDRPALTLNFDKFVKGQTCSGLEKLHLNNSVQDETFLSESVASRLYRESGVPTARAGHAFLNLNGRDLGLYVLKEGYDTLFLRRNFPLGTNAPGNLYDGGFLQDVDQELELDAGNGPTDHSDLRRLRKAANAPESRRMAELERVLDVDRFLSLLAIQALTDDWDGYGRNRNNYRLYFDPVTGRASFIPHGMDQLFNELGASVMPQWSGLIASRTLDVQSAQTRYRERLVAMTTNRFTWNWLTNHLAAVDARIQPTLAQRSPEERQQWAARLQRVSNRFMARIRNVRRQLELPPDPSLAQMAATARQPQPLSGWRPRPQQGTSRLESITTDNRETLHLTAIRGGTVASFRTSRALSAGEYSLEAVARTKGLVAGPGTPGRGAGIRISGADRQNHLTGDHDWSPLRFDFELSDDSEVEFIVEIRADRGEVWFDLASLRLVPR